MLDEGLDTTRCVESVCVVPPGDGGVRVVVPGAAVGVFIDRPFVADRVEATS